MVDSFDLVQRYLSKADWKVRENANRGYSLQGLNVFLSGANVEDYWLNHVYPPEVSQAYLNGDYHIHNLSALANYCQGWDLQDLLKVGFGHVPGKIQCAPPKHFSSALGQMVNFIFTLQGCSAGAQAFSNVDTLLAPYIREDNLTYEQVKQAVQEFVFNMNVPTRVGGESPFSNVTLDLTVPAHMKQTPVFIADKATGLTYGDYQPEMDLFNRAFAEVMVAGDAQGRVFTFPIPTYNISKAFNWESEASEGVFKMAAKYGLPYFANYINSDMSSEDSRSMCPLTSETLVLSRNNRGVYLQAIGTLVRSIQDGTIHDVWTPSGWKTAKPIIVPATPIVCLKFSNGASVRMGINHLQPVLGMGTLPAEQLKEGMWVPFNTKAVAGFKEETSKSQIPLGLAIGAYLGDGSKVGDGSIIYSLSKRKTDVLTQLIDFWSGTLGLKTDVYTKGELVSLRVYGSDCFAAAIIERFVNGDYSTEKSLKSAVFAASIDFRLALLNGLALTDGARACHRIYTSSPKLRTDLLSLSSSVGLRALGTNTDSRDGRLSTTPVYRIDFPENLNYGNRFKTIDGVTYYRITEAKREEYSGQLYCLEVDEPSHLFVLGNGLMTHNCRLRLDLRELRKKGGGLFGAEANTGSLGVVTINMPRLGYLSKTESEFFERLTVLMELARLSLKIKREIIEHYTEIGLYPYSKFYLRNVKYSTGLYWGNHFSTIGLIGMNEACTNFLNKDISTLEGKAFALRVLDFMRDKIAYFQEQDAPILYNLEATPAEGTSYRLARLDKLKYPEIKIANNTLGSRPFYTNSTNLPVDTTSDLFEALDNQEELLCKYTGGCVFHAFLGEEIGWKEAKTIVRKVLENYRIPYFTLTPTFSICPKHGYLKGRHEYCPKCDEEIGYIATSGTGVPLG